MADIMPVKKGHDLSKFRIVVVGNSEVGKTSLINQYILNLFRADYYPTSEFIIHKLLYNFNPNPGDVDEYTYIELIDTMAINKGKELQSIKEFFNYVLIYERDIHKFNNKINAKIKSRIKYDYAVQETLQSDRGLFSHDKIMAFILVFDYTNEESFKAVLDIANKIKKGESDKNFTEDQMSIFLFIGNKHDNILIDNDTLDEKEIEHSIKEDKDAYTYVNAIASRFYKNKFKDALSDVVFTSAKHNKNVKYAFNSVFNKLNQKESLWNKTPNEKKGLDEDDDDVKKKETEAKGGFFAKMFCCADAKNEEEGEKQDEEEGNLRQVLEFKKQPDDDRFDKTFFFVNKKEKDEDQVMEGGDGAAAEAPLEENKDKAGGGCKIF